MKEEDKWIKELRNHMEDYSEPLPEHGWEDLEKALSASRVIPMWRTPRFYCCGSCICGGSIFLEYLADKNDF